MELEGSSANISWLHAELHSQQQIRDELQATEHTTGWLRQRMRSVELALTADSSAQDAQYPEVSEQERELHEVREAQMCEVNEALRTALEHESRDHRSLQRKLDELQKLMRPVQHHLLRIAQAVRYWGPSIADGPREGLRPVS